VCTRVKRVLNAEQRILIAAFTLSRLSGVLSEIGAAVADPDASAKVIELAAVQLKEADQVMPGVGAQFVGTHLLTCNKNTTYLQL